jgi:asparaginyl-tRNA synthetase
MTQILVPAPSPPAPGRALPPPLFTHLSAPTTRAALTIQDLVIDTARQHLRHQGFVELLPPTIGPVTDPGGRGSKQVDIDFYGHRYKLMSSAILYKQAALLAFDKVFSIAPNVRLEPIETCHTGRHLVEFHQIDVELAGAGYTDAMAVAEGLVTACVRRVVDHGATELAQLGRDPEAFADLLTGRFDTLTHAEAVDRLRTLGHPQSSDAEIDWVAEELLSRQTSRPFFVTDYPKGSRGFYDRESRLTPGLLENFDLIAPEGYGELVSGSQREAEYARVVGRIRESGENPAKYDWYLDLMRSGAIPASAGFGLGAQRFTRYLTGVESIWQATAFPKLPGVRSA